MTNVEFVRVNRPQAVHVTMYNYKESMVADEFNSMCCYYCIQERITIYVVQVYECTSTNSTVKYITSIMIIVQLKNTAKFSKHQ